MTSTAATPPLLGSNDRRNITVTGGSGLVGREAVAVLRAQGHRVTTLDLRPLPGGVFGDDGRSLSGDVRNPGDVLDAVDGADTVVHLAGIAGSGMAPDAATFEANVNGSYNVFRLAARCGVRRVIWASTEGIFGLPFTHEPPVYLPVDDDHPCRPRTAYSISKVMCERLAELVALTAETSFIGLRLAHVMDAVEYGELSKYRGHPRDKAWDLWSYVDVRDVAQAIALAVDAESVGATCALISAADTISPLPSRELAAEVFGDGVPVSTDLGETGALFSTHYAHELLGFQPRHSWRDSVSSPSTTERAV